MLSFFCFSLTDLANTTLSLSLDQGTEVARTLSSPTLTDDITGWVHILYSVVRIGWLPVDSPFTNILKHKYTHM